MTDRMNLLLEKAADAFADGSNPFEHHWLAENNVTLDECVAMTEYISAAIRAMVKVCKR